jgi:hypothetical protein
MLRPNHLHPPFNDRRAREALLHVMDQVTYLHLIIGQSKYYRPCYSVFACKGPYATPVGAEPIAREARPMKCPRCQHGNRPQTRFCQEFAGAFKAASPTTRSHADDLGTEGRLGRGGSRSRATLRNSSNG